MSEEMKKLKDEEITNHCFRLGSDSAAVWQAGFEVGHLKTLELMQKTHVHKAKVEALKEKVKYHAQAYSLEIFPNSGALDRDSSRESIAANMGRHMCNVFLAYLAALETESAE